MRRGVRGLLIVMGCQPWAVDGSQQRGVGANAHSTARAEGVECTGQGKGRQIEPLAVGVSRQFGTGRGRVCLGGRTSAVVLVVGAKQRGSVHSISPSGMDFEKPINLVRGICGDGR